LQIGERAFRGRARAALRAHSHAIAASSDARGPGRLRAGARGGEQAEAPVADVQLFEKGEKSMYVATPLRFTLKFADPLGCAAWPGFDESLAAAGCGDAKRVVARRGCFALAFERTASAARPVVLKALGQVYAAGDNLRFVEAAPDLVCLREAAVYAGCSRQNLARPARRKCGFPLPAHDGNPELFHLSDVLRWLRRRNHYAVGAAALDLAMTTRQVNLARQLAQFNQWYVPVRWRVARFAMEPYGL
jgi:hypothetical protein